MANDRQEEFLENNEPENKNKADITEAVTNESAGAKETAEMRDKYLRLYADFENYKRQANKNKEELIKYSNEGLMKELLTVLDNLELALQHSNDTENSTALTRGIEITLKELKTILEKFGLTSIESLEKPFDPSVHHAMTQIESDEHDENTVVKEFRKGYMIKDRVLRASLVGVSKKPSQNVKTEPEEE